MSAVTLPITPGLRHFAFTVPLEAVTYGFEFRWNSRDSSWSMTISDKDGNPILAGRKVVVGLPLTARFRDARLPPGEIAAIDTAGEDRDPGAEDFGDRVVLVYTEAADLPAEFVA